MVKIYKRLEKISIKFTCFVSFFFLLSILANGYAKMHSFNFDHSNHISKLLGSVQLGLFNMQVVFEVNYIFFSLSFLEIESFF